MALCMIVENRDLTAAKGEQVMARVRESGPVPPEGARLVVAGPATQGWRVVSVWDSEEARDRFFAERLRPAYQEAGLSLDSIERTQFEVHTLVAGDLTGAPAARACRPSRCGRRLARASPQGPGTGRCRGRPASAPRGPAAPLEAAARPCRGRPRACRPG